jgi:hypothetical protein
MYAHIHDGVIAAPQDLPQTWSHPDGRTVSNLHALNDDELVQLGWYRVSDSGQPTFDPQTQALDAYYVFDEDIVCVSYQIRTASPDEISRAKAHHNAPLLAELSALDLKIPRGLEDAWVATGFDTATLPAFSQVNLARKRQLRLGLK